MPYADRPPATLDALERQGREFAKVPDVAVIMNCDPRTVVESIRSGDIPAIKAGREYRIPVAWLRRAAAGETIVSR